MESQRRDRSEATSAGPVVFIVDDHKMLAEALERALTGRGFRCHCAELGSAQAVVEQAVRLAPDLVLLDLDLGGIDGLELVGALRAAGRRVVVVTGCQDHQRLAAAVALGSMGWVVKSRPFEDILDAVESACRDRPFLGRELREHLTSTGREYLYRNGDMGVRMSTLTPREREVVNAIIRGDSAQAMADRFVVSVGTVRTHIQSVLSKLGVTSQLAAAALVIQWSASKRGLDRENLVGAITTSA
jgi:DNA-binding NarL/FixJ family response regulator